MTQCRMKNCPLKLLFKSFYDKSLPVCFVRSGHGVGLTPLFVLSVLSALTCAVGALIAVVSFSPESVAERVKDLPAFEIKNGKIVSPENFVRGFDLGGGLRLTVDTAAKSDERTEAAPNEIRISADGVSFVKGHRVDLMPLNEFLETDNVTVTAQNVADFARAVAAGMTYTLPPVVLAIAVPVLFFKYVFLTYLLALFTYAATLFSKTSLPFEARMRLAAISALPVFVFDFVFDSLLGLFGAGAFAGVAVTLVYLWVNLGRLSRAEPAE